MRINLRLLFIILSLVLVAAMISKSEPLGIDPGLPDTLVVDSVVAFTAGSAVVPIRIINDEPLDAIEITLRYHSHYITLDSFSFAGGRLEFLGFKGRQSLDDSTINIYAQRQTEASVPAGSGTIGSLYFSWPSDIPIHTVAIDTVTFTKQFLEYSTSFKQDNFAPFLPQYIPGQIDIQATPFVLDSIWITDTVGYQGRPMTVDVNLFNERNLKRVSVALAYGDGELHFDSATFEGSRGLTAFPRSVQKNHTFNQLWLSLEWPDESPLPPGSGVLAHLHFTVAQDAPLTPVEIITEDYLGVTTTFIDLTAADGSLQIYPIFHSGFVTIEFATDVEEGYDGLPNQFDLGQNYPNPFNPETTIKFALPTGEDVTLTVINVLGQSVRELVNDRLPAGYHSIVFDGRNDQGKPLASGVYFYSLVAGEFKEASKMILLK